jgi:NusA-like KH domain protein
MTSNTIDMQLMRYINLFEKISRVSTTNCFIYNNSIVFAVQKKFVSRAIGKDAANVKKMRNIIGKKIKVIEERELKDLDKFISDVVEPAVFNKLEINNGAAVISASRQSKATLIGRGRAREQELQNILKKFYNIEKLRIV